MALLLVAVCWRLLIYRRQKGFGIYTDILHSLACIYIYQEEELGTNISQQDVVNGGWRKIG